MRNLNEILEEVLECTFFDDISKDNCESWDSINHVNIILELQDEYDIKISPQDIDKLLSYQSILHYLKKQGISAE
ncbi:acyl carrier protein [Pectobacterium polonicum]|uniref:acyl carrier protein n=1 Tax=Pectobacterium polonicum TaxID=2485124 RepID=UPI0010F54176|nr:acyl carrier protein [Pectobacterium polonicum]TKY80200.1 acyl carrier protein [Pectobacterium polonicum]